MKKFFVAFLVFCAAIFGCLSSGCAGQFTDDGYNVIQDYGYSFRSVAATEGNVKLAFEDSLYDAMQADAQDLLSRLSVDYAAIDELFNLGTHINFYIIEDSLRTSYMPSSFYTDGAVYCRAGAIEEEGYRASLCGAYLNTTQPWKQFAAESYVFGTETDNVNFAEYYSESHNVTTLSLFAAYFNDEFADDQIIQTTKATAAEYGAFLLENYGTEEFLNAGLDGSRRTEWLTSVGAGEEYSFPYDLSWLDGAEYSRKIGYPLVITTDNRVYNIAPLDGTFDTPEKVLLKLAENHVRMEAVMTEIEVCAPSVCDIVFSKYNAMIEYYISENEGSDNAQVDNSRVYLVDISEFVHETVHVITLNHTPADGLWLSEGIAEYFSRKYCNDFTQTTQRFYNAFSMDGLTGTLGRFVECAKDRYLALGGSMESASEFDFALMERAIAYATLNNPEFKEIDDFPFGTMSVAERNLNHPFGYEGNDLTYPESLLFTEYLIETYGIDKVLSAHLMNNSFNFSATFGASYEEVFAAFINTL